MIGELIVDVPLQQTNQTYDYRIPLSMEKYIQVGMRVEVPFGRRQVQAYLVGLKADSDFQGELKEISQVLDEEPVFNQEQLELTGEMADRTYNYYISFFHMILPNLYKVDYEKRVYPKASLEADIKQELFGEQASLRWSESKQQGQILSLVKEGKVEIITELKDKAKQKMETWIQPLYDYPYFKEEIFDKIPPNAHRQRDLVAVLMDLDGQQIAWDLLRKEYNFSLATIKTAEEKGWLKRLEKPLVLTYGEADQVSGQEAYALNAEQGQVFGVISRAIKNKISRTYLLEGVTGSGKTEIYLQAIAKVLQQGQSAIILMPEIGLTTQMIDRFEKRYPNQIAVLHSQISPSEQFNEWQAIKKGQKRIVLGTRSAIFAPCQDLGIIIMDEEHDGSYKQNDTPRYHARDIAKWRSAYHSCPLLLGSATPSLESRARAEKNNYQLLMLNQRVNQRALPTVEIVDMREESRRKNYHTFSLTLYDKIQERLNRKEQIILLLNRRGYASYRMCRECGHNFECPNCDISLTYHRATESMKCHFCGHDEPLINRCPQCQSTKVRSFGMGTQKIEEEIGQLFPQARTLRMDVDTTRRKGQHGRLLKKFADHEADILLGTQMIAKGLDFENVTLVGVLNADSGLNIPDFRASEQTFQLLTQVSGRAGRGEKPGEVVIQTFNPEHYAIQLAAEQNYERFFYEEMQIRRLGQYPPYFFTAKLVVSAIDDAKARDIAFKIRRDFNEMVPDQVFILGPTQQALRRLNNRYYYQVLMKFKDQALINQALVTIRDRYVQSHPNIYVSIDMNPTQFF